MKRIILITGGQRSGKSSKAEELALSLSENPVYISESEYEGIRSVAGLSGRTLRRRRP